MRAHVLPENFHANTSGKNYTTLLIFQAGWQYAMHFAEGGSRNAWGAEAWMNRMI